MSQFDIGVHLQKHKRGDSQQHFFKGARAVLFLVTDESNNDLLEVSNQLNARTQREALADLVIGGVFVIKNIFNGGSEIKLHF